MGTEATVLLATCASLIKEQSLPMRVRIIYLQRQTGEAKQYMSPPLLASDLISSHVQILHCSKALLVQLLAQEHPNLLGTSYAFVANKTCKMFLHC